MAAPINKSNLCEFSGKSLNSKRLLAYETKTFDNVCTIDYSKYLIEYLIPNRPCIFSSKLTDSWQSRKRWVADDGSPNLEYLRKHFGDAIVPVADCKQERYSSHPKRDLALREYLSYWEAYRNNGYPGTEECLYLKDWHFTKAFPDYEAYQTPQYFRSDWLNEFWDTKPDDDYRFVYMGPKGTWTPFHSDVYRSFSWSANICGRKKWIFYPPGCEDSLKNRFGQLVYDVTSTDLEDSSKFPNAHKVKGRALEVVQERGQVIFVPSGWHHQVYNLEDTISINHNWLNGCNIDISWRHLQSCLADVKREIADCRDMEGWQQQCQLILNASAGIDYHTFIQLLKVVAERRVTYLESKVISPDMPFASSISDSGIRQDMSKSVSPGSAEANTDADFGSIEKIQGLIIEQTEDSQKVVLKETDECDALETVSKQPETAARQDVTADNCCAQRKQKHVNNTNRNSVDKHVRCCQSELVEMDNVKNEISTDDSAVTFEDKVIRAIQMKSDNENIEAGETKNAPVADCEDSDEDIEQRHDLQSERVTDKNGKADCDKVTEDTVILQVASADCDNQSGDKCEQVIMSSCPYSDLIDSKCVSDDIKKEVLNIKVIKDANTMDDRQRSSESVSKVNDDGSDEIATYNIGMGHIEYDLLRVKEVLSDIVADDDYKHLQFDFVDSAEYVLELLDKINL